MHCTNCKKEVVEGSEFCSYCGSKINNEVKTLDKTTEEIEQKIKQKKKIGKGLIIVIICCIALITSAVYFTIIVDNDNSNDLENISKQEDNNTKQENMENLEKEIPEDRKVTVRFIETGKNDSVEYREVDRDALINCLNKLYSSVRNAGLSLNMGLYTYEMALYYVEYDYKIEGFDKVSNSIYGAIMYSYFIKSGYATTYCKTFVANWTPFNNIDNSYSAIYESSLSKIIPSKETLETIRNNRIWNDIANSIKVSKNTEYSNIRVGFINVQENEWLQEYFDNVYNENEIDESINNSNIVNNNTEINTSENNYQQNIANNNNNSEMNNVDDIDDTLEITSITLKNGNDLSQAGNFTSRTENITLELEVDLNIGNDVEEADKNFSATINGENVSISESALDHSMNPNIKFVKNNITLKLGENTFKVNVTNGKGVSKSKTYTITFDPYKPKFYSTYTHGNVLYIEVRNEEYTELESSFTVTVNGKNAEKEYTSSLVERFAYVIEEGETEFNIVATDKYRTNYNEKL